MNRRANFNIMMGLMFFTLTLLFLVAIHPVLKETFNLMKNSERLNCKGYVDTDPALSYNSSLPTETVGCVGASFGIPYIILAVIIGGLASVVTGKQEAPVQYYG